MVSFTLFLLAVSGLVFSKLLLDDYFSPIAVYNFFWAFALGAYALDWVDYEPVRDAGYQVLGLGYLGFMGGALLPTLYGLIRNQWASNPIIFPELDRIKFERTLLILFGLGIFGFVVQLAHLQATVGLGSFLSDPSATREHHTNIQYLGFFNLLNVANFVLALSYLIIYKKPRKWMVIIMVWAVATTFLTTDRTRFFYMVIWSFYIGMYIPRRVNLTPKIIGALCITLFTLFGFFIMIAKMYKKEAFEDNMEFVNISQEYASLVDPYIYLTGSFPVFQAFLDDKQPMMLGKRTFEPFVKVLELLTPDVERAEIVGKFYRVPIELNACTYLEPFYLDFGILGVFIGPLLCGLGSMWAYLHMRRKKTIFTIYFSALLCFCATISIFVNHFIQTATWFFVIVGFVVYQTTRTPQSKEDQNFHPYVKH